VTGQILVTGRTGTLGRVVVRRLVAQGRPVGMILIRQARPGAERPPSGALPSGALYKR
jgi:nucleoside-diphosphate-sugar epimerase